MNLKEIIFEEGSRLKKIGPKSFNRSGIERIVIPRGVEEIQESTFSWCTNLKEVVFEEGSELKTIGESVFSDCSNLAKINLPDGLVNVDDWTFCDCKNLKNIRLPSGLEKIGVACFYGSGLEEVILPASVKEVCADTFRDCK